MLRDFQLRFYGYFAQLFLVYLKKMAAIFGPTMIDPGKWQSNYLFYDLHLYRLIFVRVVATITFTT